MKSAKAAKKPAKIPDIRTLVDTLHRAHQRARNGGIFDPTKVRAQIEEAINAAEKATIKRRLAAMHETEDFFSDLAEAMEDARRQIETAIGEPNFVRELVVVFEETDDDGMEQSLKNLSAEIARLQAMASHVAVTNHVPKSKEGLNLQETPLIIRRIVRLYEDVTGINAATERKRPHLVDFAKAFLAHVGLLRARATVSKGITTELKDRRDRKKWLAKAFTKWRAAAAEADHLVVLTEPVP